MDDSTKARGAAGCWLGQAVSQIALTAVKSDASLSGAAIWQVSDGPRLLCLRAWPTHAADRVGVSAIHGLQLRLESIGPKVTPIPLRSQSGDLLVDYDGRLWELSTWRPGVADLADRPALRRLETACETLAQIHLAAAQHDPLPRPSAPSPALGRRVVLAEQLVAGGMAQLQQSASGIADTALRDLLCEGLARVARMLLAVLSTLSVWQHRPLPLQWRLTDVRREHVLFSGDEVTGLVDFGAAAVDAPAGDLARLLGSMAPDQPDLWHAGVAAYERSRPLTPDERAVLPVLDVSGLCLSLANWARWLTQADSGQAVVDRTAAAARVDQLVRRLRRQENFDLARIAAQL